MKVSNEPKPKGGVIMTTINKEMRDALKRYINDYVLGTDEDPNTRYIRVALNTEEDTVLLFRYDRERNTLSRIYSGNPHVEVDESQLEEYLSGEDEYEDEYEDDYEDEYEEPTAPTGKKVVTLHFPDGSTVKVKSQQELISAVYSRVGAAYVVDRDQGGYVVNPWSEFEILPDHLYVKELNKSK